MELYSKIINFIDVNLVYCLTPMILTLILVEFLFKTKYPTKEVLNSIRWFIISYTVLIIIHSFIVFIISPEDLLFLKNGNYVNYYLFMFLSATILPLTLLFKKLSSNFIYVLFIAFVMKIGVYLEKYTIVMSKYLNSNSSLYNGDSNWLSSYLIGIPKVWIKGFLIGIIALVIFNFSNSKNQNS